MQKSKRGEPRSIGRGRFVLIWTVMLNITYLLSLILIALIIMPLRHPTSALAVVAAAEFIRIIVFAFTQVYLIQILLKHSMRGWLLTVLGALAIFWVLFFVADPLIDELNRLEREGQYVFGILGQLIGTIPLAVFQGLWLSRRVKHAWRWGLAIIVMDVVFYIVISIFPRLGLIDTVFAGVIVLFRIAIENIIMGLLIYSLFLHPNAREIARQEATAAARRLAESREAEMQRVNETVISRVYAEG